MFPSNFLNIKDLLIVRKFYFIILLYINSRIRILILLNMDDLTFQIKNLEFHLKQISMQYDKCVSKALKNFLDHADVQFSGVIKPCESIKLNLDDLMKKYEILNSSKLNN